MANSTLESIKESINVLSEEEQTSLLSWIKSRQDTHQASSVTELDRALMQAGLLPQLPMGLMDKDAHENWCPVPIQGKPLSETISEERS